MPAVSTQLPVGSNPHFVPSAGQVWSAYTYHTVINLTNIFIRFYIKQPSTIYVFLFFLSLQMCLENETSHDDKNDLLS